LEHTRCVSLSKWQRVRYAYASLQERMHRYRRLPNVRRRGIINVELAAKETQGAQGGRATSHRRYAIAKSTTQSNIHFGVEKTKCDAHSRLDFAKSSPKRPRTHATRGAHNLPSEGGLRARPGNSQDHESSGSDRSLLNIKALNHAGCATVTCSF